jgi:hypothetical protein
MKCIHCGGPATSRLVVVRDASAFGSVWCERHGAEAMRGFTMRMAMGKDSITGIAVTSLPQLVSS